MGPIIGVVMSPNAVVMLEFQGMLPLMHQQSKLMKQIKRTKCEFHSNKFESKRRNNVPICKEVKRWGRNDEGMFW